MQDMDTATLTIGDRITAGKGDDHSHGRIIAIDGDRAEVAWGNANDRTWSPIADLAPEGAEEGDHCEDCVTAFGDDE